MNYATTSYFLLQNFLDENDSVNANAYANANVC